MVITRISDYGIKISQGSLTIAVNPPVNKKDASGGVFSADLVLLSSPNTGFDSAEHFSKSSKDTFIIDSAGEYEKDGLFVYGMQSSTNHGGAKAINTDYYFNLDDMDVCILGAHEPESLPNKITEIIDNVDILIIPVVGNEVMSPIAANKLLTKLEAKVVIPTGATTKKDPNLAAFCDEFSHEIVETDKLNLKSKDLPVNPVAYIIS